MCPEADCWMCHHIWPLAQKLGRQLIRLQMDGTKITEREIAANVSLALVWGQEIALALNENRESIRLLMMAPTLITAPPEEL